MAKNRIYLTLSVKLIFTISLVIIFTSVVLSLFFIDAQEKLLKGFIENKAETLARTLASASEYGVLESSKELLSRLTRTTITQSDVLYSVIYSTEKNFEVLAESNTDPNLMKYVLSKPINQALVSTLEKDRFQKRIYSREDIGEIIEVFIPVMSRQSSSVSNRNFSQLYYKNRPLENRTIGVVRVGFSLRRINYQIDKMTNMILFITLTVILISIIISSFLVKMLINPIHNLTIGTKKIASGNFGYRVPITTRDEFKDLGISFNSMATDMEIHIKELNKEKKELLDLKVAFEQRSQELEETLDKVQEIQNDLIRTEKFATIGRLASTVAHELRNPLAGIKNISYFLSKMGAFSDEKSKQMVNMLSSEVVRANKIITDLLDYSKTKKLNKQEVPIESFIDKSISSVPMPDNIKVIKEIKKMMVLVDPDKMTQIIINLLSNARDAMPPEGGKIIVRTRKDIKKFYIDVEDTACGMDEETIKHLFEPLFTTKLKGIGLGLAIVKEIIEAHAGKILVKSTKGVGTTFTIEMPL